MAEKPKTFEELTQDRAKEWAQQQARAAREIEAFQAEVKQMPDVAHPPDPRQPWGEDGIACAQRCGSEGFKVRRFVTVNGHRHRAELVCLGCGDVGTWDFNENRWLR